MKLIPLDALLAEIEKLIDKGEYLEDYDCAYRDGNNGALYELKNKLDTLEGKEVDLEKEIDDYIDHKEVCEIQEAPLTSIENAAKHFFELGLKAQKG